MVHVCHLHEEKYEVFVVHLTQKAHNLQKVQISIVSEYTRRQLPQLVVAQIPNNI